jgi:hypothetical protein
MNTHIEICMDNGKKHSFELKTPEDKKKILEEVSTMRFLKQASLILASDQYLANIQPKSIEIIRCYLPDEGAKAPGKNDEDVLEISKETLVEEYLKLPEAEKFSSRNKAPGEFMTTFLEIHTEGNEEVFLRLHLKKKQSQEGRLFITNLFEQPFFRFRLAEGGFGIIIPSKITCQYTYPGPSPDVLPANTLNVS